MAVMVSNVLLIINEEGHVRELARLAEILLRTSDIRPVIYIEDRMQHLNRPDTLGELGVEMLTSKGVEAKDGQAALGRGRRTRFSWRAALATKAARTMVRYFPDRIRRRLIALNSQDIAFIDQYRDAILKRAGVAAEILSERSYSAIVLCEDNVELDTAVWIEVAHRKGIKSVIVPYTISNTAEFLESYVWHPPYQVSTNVQNGLTARLFPTWTQRYKGSHFLRTIYPRIFAVELLGLSPPDPWLLNSGSADAICVESLAMMDYYRTAGIPERQLVLTGSLADDVIAQVEPGRLRQSLVQEFGLAHDRPFLIAALPPDQNTFDRPGCEFRDFDDLIEFWGQTLSGLDGWNILVRPHPKTRPDRVERLKNMGLAISYHDTAELVAICDVYIASVSATIRWAIACGKPVINYDVYQYGYRDYAGVDGVVLVGTRAEFTKAISRITREPSYREQLTQTQRRYAARWGMLDGASGKRMIELLGGESKSWAAVPLQCSDIAAS